MIARVSFAVLFLGFLAQTQAQIMSDSVSVYGYKSTFYTLERDLLQQDSVLHQLDTSTWRNSMDYLHAFSLENSYQYLGVLGTASRNLYHLIIPTIGFKNGWDAYDLYQFDHEKQKYFHARSPYSCLSYVQSSTGENGLNTTFSRSISQYAQFGMQLNRFTSRKNIAALGQRSLDKLTDHYNFLGYTMLRTKNNRYRALLSFSAMRHWAVESGGLIHPLNRTLNKDSIIQNFITQPVYFNTNSTRTLSEINKGRLYHDFSLSQSLPLRIYHILEAANERNAFYTASFPTIDNGNPDPSLFFQNTFFDTISTNYYLKNNKMDNQVGLSFRKKAVFVQTYLSGSDFSFEEVENQDTTQDVLSKTNFQTFRSLSSGFLARLFLSNSFSLQSKAKYQLAFTSANKEFQKYFYNRNDYENELILQHPIFQIGIGRYKVSPTLIQTYIRSNHFIWSNDFKAQEISQVFAKGEWKHKDRHQLKWDVLYQGIEHFVYMDSNATPKQTNLYVDNLKVGFFYGLRFGKFHLDNQVIYANTNQSDIVRLPSWNYFNKSYVEGNLFHKALILQIGAMVNYQSSYRALAYMPALQSFYLQNHFYTQGEPNISLFACGKIKSATLWARIAHLNQNMSNGYFETPNYPALRTSLVFGINWEFFN